MLTPEMKNSLNESVLCWLSTIGADGYPNCSPKEIFTFVEDAHIVVADIASPVSRQNVLDNPLVCVSFVHVLKQKGFKVKGVAHYIEPSDSEFADLFVLLEPMVGDVFPVRGLFNISVTQIQPIIAPGYFIIPGTTEASQIEKAKQVYGV
ncbi:pyridoxamine 5'-phosphate oxidase family protein [Marinomonas balearica]|uniref:Pyridoxamine 5'-phosphate oxidase N-terminal domain-containing protein n=1 Tax=Marinomonas balearica TaxID=491947 RepID=A0A4R6M6E1_9GAMM|nr:pyridoxamine 5'-phosphate oxidase family protein [Marinomonas balearica]TDO96948.1 hypothetical protein DFP79_2719 [Marinomonas balearica]